MLASFPCSNARFLPLPSPDWLSRSWATGDGASGTSWSPGSRGHCSQPCMPLAMETCSSTPHARLRDIRSPSRWCSCSLAPTGGRLLCPPARLVHQLECGTASGHTRGSLFSARARQGTCVHGRALPHTWGTVVRALSSNGPRSRQLPPVRARGPPQGSRRGRQSMAVPAALGTCGHPVQSWSSTWRTPLPAGGRPPAGAVGVPGLPAAGPLLAPAMELQSSTRRAALDLTWP